MKNTARPALFQFHKGTIKTNIKYPISGEKPISIP